ncbi:PEP-CTERM sorting domain-containing protein [Trichocoleus sp. FACHB-591]|uniref:DUF7453 family protein n=1 Tax=Trichocoleus sp. FACHB-591 TaxID=2692872 RepID=UPI001684DCD7|nr:choice-of-anchor tandem repeat NxxGxxAF-containing protein [Trichocoleus sp. FACHB-591]MBD2094925.1 PEP-CTERM sorting domain-containing protein [Trichocoleus sp. FACHB-591]
MKLRMGIFRDMKLDVAFPVAVVGVTVSFLASAEAQAYTFTRIADTSGQFSSFSSFPVINDHGIVSFWAGLDVGETGIFAGDGATTTTIADTSGAFRSFDTLLSINNQGTVAFTSFLDSGSGGIFASNGQTATTIAPFTGLEFGPPSINDSGTVAFFTDSFYGKANVVISDGRTTTVISEVGDSFFKSTDSPSINNAGTAAYVTTEVGRKITTTDGRAIASTGTFGFVGYPSINDTGTVAFVAGAFGTTLGGIFKSDGTTSTLVADSNGAFSSFSFGTPSINNAGTVAFFAPLKAGGLGIFTGPDPIADKVIAAGNSWQNIPGDPLFGSTVTSLWFSREGLNNVGQITFYARLADGTEGIYRADPDIPNTPSKPETKPGQDPAQSVPEPTSGIGLLLLGAIGLGSKLKLRLTK